MKKMKKLLTAALLLGALASCGETPAESQQQSVVAEARPLESNLVGIAKGKTCYLTSVGQGDLEIVNSILESAGVETTEYISNNVLNAADVEKDAVVFLTVGASSKGLGAAGVDEASEKARAQAFSAGATAGNFTVILFHIGGTNRRGGSSDPIIEAAFPGASACFVSVDGNSDGFFNTLASGTSTDLYNMPSAIDLVAYTAGLFGKQ